MAINEFIADYSGRICHEAVSEHYSAEEWYKRQEPIERDPGCNQPDAVLTRLLRNANCHLLPPA